MKYITGLGDERTLLGMLICIEKRKELLKEIADKEREMNSLTLKVDKQQHIATEKLIDTDVSYYTDENGKVLFEGDRTEGLTKRNFKYILYKNYTFLPTVMVIGMIMGCVCYMLFRLVQNDLFFMLMIVGLTMAVLSALGILVLYMKLLDEYRDEDIMIKHNESAKKEEQRRKEENIQRINRNNVIRGKNEEIDRLNNERKKAAVIAYNNNRAMLEKRIDNDKKAVEMLETQFKIWQNELRISPKLCQGIADDKTLISLCDCYDMVRCNIHTRKHSFEDVQEYYYDYLIDERRHQEIVKVIDAVRDGMIRAKEEIDQRFDSLSDGIYSLNRYIQEVDSHIQEVGSHMGSMADYIMRAQRKDEGDE